MTDELLQHDLILHLQISYSDLSGKKYKSPAKVVWDHLRDEVIEVSPGVIVRDLGEQIP